MAKPTTREQFKEYVCRKITGGVTQLNLSDEAIDDRIDEALDFFADYHFSGSDQIYLKHQVTQTDIENGYITVPERLIGVVRIFDLNSAIGTGGGMFDVSYQFALNNMQDISGYSIENYWMVMQHMRFIQEWLVGVPMIRYNRNINKVMLDFKTSKLSIGSYIIVEAYDIIDPAENTNIWSDRWLQNYASVLIAESWGKVLTKFVNMQLVGGLQFNGEQILSDATAERKALEESAISGLQPLIYNMTG